jgi:hypothetical protein
VRLGAGEPPSSPEAVAAIEEAIHVIRALWTPGRGVRLDGEHYRLAGAHPARSSSWSTATARSTGVIHDVLNRVDAALVATVSDPRGITELSDAVDLLTDSLLSHLSYEERELVEPLARLGIG